MKRAVPPRWITPCLVGALLTGCSSGPAQPSATGSVDDNIESVAAPLVDAPRPNPDAGFAPRLLSAASSPAQPTPLPLRVVWAAAEGTRVGPGDPLVRFDTTLLEAAVTSAQADAQAASANVTLLGARIDDVDEKASELRDKRQEATDALETLADKREELEQQRSDLADKREEVAGTLRDLRAKRDEITRRLEPLPAQREQLTDTIATLAEQRSEVEDTQSRLLRQRDQADEALTRLPEQRQALEARLAQASAVLSAQPTPELRAQVQQLTGALQQLDGQLAAARSAKDRIDAGLAQASAGQAKLDAGLARARDGLKTLDAAAQKASEARAQVDAGIGKATAGLDQIDTGLQALDAGLDKVREARETATDAIASIDEGLGDLADARVKLVSGRRLAAEASRARQLLVEQAQQRRDRAVVTSPSAGTVVSVRPVGSVALGGTPVASVRPSAPRTVTLWLDPSEASGLCPNGPATLTTDGGEHLAGRITRVGVRAEYPPSSVATQRVHLARAVAVTVLPEAELPPGLPVDVTLPPC